MGKTDEETPATPDPTDPAAAPADTPADAPVTDAPPADAPVVDTPDPADSQVTPADVAPPGDPDNPADVANHAAALAGGGILGGPVDQVQARLDRSEQMLARDKALADDPNADVGPVPESLPPLVGSVEHGQSPSVPTPHAPSAGVSTGEAPAHTDPWGGNPPATPVETETPAE